MTAEPSTLAIWSFRVGIGGLIALGIALRVIIWLSPYGVPESDEAVGGLMAKHIFSGGLSVFYWGQGYGGPLEVVLAAPFVAIFGGSWVALRLVPIVLCAVTALVVLRIGLRTIGRYGAITAAAVYWTFPSYLLWKSIHFHIFYASGMLFGALAVLLVLRLRAEPSKRDMILLGFVAGLGLWQSFQLVTVIPVAVAWLLWRRRETLRLALYAVPGLVVGFVPVLISNLRHSWWSLDLGQSGIQSTYFSRIGTFYTNTLPMALDLRASCTRHWFLAPAAGIALYVVLVALFLLFAWRAWGTNRELLVVVVGVFPFIYAINQLTGMKATPIYVLLLSPLLAVVICAGISKPIQGLWAMGAVALLLGGVFIDLRSNEVNGNVAPGCVATWASIPRDLGPLVATLETFHIDRVYAGYWLAYRLDYATNERIIAAEARSSALFIRPGGGVVPSPDDASLHPRHLQYGAIVSRVPKPAWVIERDLEGPNLDGDMFKVAGYRSKDVGRFTIYWHGVDSKGTP